MLCRLLLRMEMGYASTCQSGLASYRHNDTEAGDENDD